MNDLDLINRLKHKDESVLTDLIDIYGDLIYRAANKVLNNKEFSEECLNTVLLKIWEGIEFYNKDSGLFKNWIFTLSKYTAIDMLRKEVKHSKNTIQLKEYIHSSSLVEDIVLVNETMNEIRKNMKDLNDVEKQIFVERYKKGNKVKDIANKLGITPKALSLRIIRIKEKLKINN